MADTKNPPSGPEEDKLEDAVKKLEKLEKLIADQSLSMKKATGVLLPRPKRRIPNPSKRQPAGTTETSPSGVDKKPAVGKGGPTEPDK